MKDKEMIEEIALQFAKKYCKACGCENCDCAYEFGTKEESCEDYLHYKQMAEHFYNLGYRKLPKDSVVLSMEDWKEYEQFKSFMQRNEWESVEQMETTLDKCQDILYERLQQSSKETAEKILKWFRKHFYGTGWCVVETYFKEQFGVEIKE